MSREAGTDGDVPVSVRLGTVVPPEDPEDWTRPLTWVAAAGMLLAPIAAVAWFALASPRDESTGALSAALAAALPVGATATGWTQMGRGRAAAATLGGALFGALGTVIVGTVFAGEPRVGNASPTVAHAASAALAGLVGSVPAAVTAWSIARRAGRIVRFVAPAAVGATVAIATTLIAA